MQFIMDKIQVHILEMNLETSIVGNSIKEDKLCNYKLNYDYKGINNSLSEYIFPNYIKALDYEVFQVIFTDIIHLKKIKRSS